MASTTCSSNFSPPANRNPFVFSLPPSNWILSFPPPRRSRSRGGSMGIVAAMAAERNRRWKYKGTYEKERRLEDLVERKVKEAEEACKGDDLGSDGCKVAWDEVDEVTRAKAELRRRIMESGADPLEGFCTENPEADECRPYED